MDSEGGLCHRLRDLQEKLKGMEEQVRSIVKSSGWPPSNLLTDRPRNQEAGAALSCCRECKGNFGSKWLRSGCCWQCRSVLRNSGRCSTSNSPMCMVCPHLQACFACDGISCSVCGVVRSVSIESDGSLHDWLLELQPQPQTLYLDFDATLCNTASGGAPQIGKHALHGELAAVVESGAFQIVIVTKQNPQHHLQIATFLEALGWKEGREYLLHCIGGTGVSKSSVIQANMKQHLEKYNTPQCAVFIDDSIKEILRARSELPPSVITLVFAAVKSSYVKTRCVPYAASVSMQKNSSAFAATPHADNDDAVILMSDSASAAKLEHLLGVKVGAPKSAENPGTIASHPRSMLPSSTSATAESDKDGPGWQVSAQASPESGVSSLSSSGPYAGNMFDNFRLSVSFCNTAYAGFEASTTLEQLRRLQESWVIERNWTQYHTPRNLVLALVGEVGELAELFQWRGEVACNLPGWTERRKSKSQNLSKLFSYSDILEREHLGEELSDVFLYLVRLADVCAVDLVSSIKSKIQKNGVKYPKPNLV